MIVAAGSGERFGGPVPKQFLPLGGRPLVDWCVRTALSTGRVSHVTVVLPPGAPDAWSPGADDAVSVTPGGCRRVDSVRNGIGALPPATTHCLVHDAVRPLASAGLFHSVMDAAEAGGAAVPVMPINDTVKRASGGMVTETVDRSGLHASQTPQGFRIDLLRAALGAPGDYTDESSALEASGVRVAAVAGEAGNIKLTRPSDMPLLEALGGVRPTRTALGLDFHPFEPGRPLHLCGCLLPGEDGLAGHSDGDAGLHAVMDAMLSASGLGDIGTHFPPDDPAWKGADSSVLAGRVVDLLAGAGWVVDTLDLTIVGNRPRIAPIRGMLSGRLAAILGTGEGSIGVKGTTTNTLGDLGRGGGLGALALVVIRRAPA